MTDDVMHLRSLDEINAHYRRLEILARGTGRLAEVRRQKRLHVARLLDNEIGIAKVRKVRERLRGAGR